MPIIAEPGGEPQPTGRDPRLKDVRQLRTVADGTPVKTPPRLTAAMGAPAQHGRSRHAGRLHTPVEVDRHVPARIDAADPRDSGHADEKDVLRRRPRPDRRYVLDRRFARLRLFNDLADAQSSYACRVRDNSGFEADEERPLSDAARAAGVGGDAVARPGPGSRPAARPPHRVRLAAVAAEPHEKRGGRKGRAAGPPSRGRLLTAADRPDAPAGVVALIYRRRRVIEAFFRFFKHAPGCRRPLSASPGGIAIRTCRALLAGPLISRWAGRQPTLRTDEMPCWCFLGWAGEEGLPAHLEK